MKTSRPWALLVLLPLIFGLILTGCQKSEPPAPQTAAKPAPPPPPPPPPDTSWGKFVRVERADKTKARVIYLTTSGLRSEDTVEKAGKGKTFVILHFEGKAPSREEKNWLVDGAGKKYSEGYGFASKKEERQLAYEIPADAKELIWHDGKKSYKLEPAIVEVSEPTAASATAKPAAKKP